MNDLSKKVTPIIKKTREMLMPFYGNIEIKRQKDESAHNVVTKLDEDVERYLADELVKIYPEISFVGEEFGGDRNASKFWLVDPIDGTAHFIRGLPFCTTMLALIENGQVIFSIVYDFVEDVIYHAEKGNGSYKDGKRIYISDRPVNNSYIAWESRLEKPENMNIFTGLRKNSILFKTISSGYEYALVAEGKIEGRICFDPYGKDYDFAPGSLLVSEAGGVVTNIGTNKYDYRNTNFLAVNKNLYEKLTQGREAIFPVL